MDTMDYGNLAYLVLLGAVVVFWFFVQNRQSLGKTAQQALVWGLIFLGVIAAVGLWDDIRNTVRPAQAVFADQGRVEVPRAPDGHYYLTLDLNGNPVEFVIDTGATNVVLSRDDAARAGIDPEGLNYVGRAMTANGEVRTAPVRLDRVSMGPIVDENVRAWVNEGDMPMSLLGMDYLQRWSRIEIARGALVLER